ncbi:hypothetical protein FIV42_10795 [Persicimonas caeni]|uniref:DUF5683 domain-containing protein n=1 Tax=Persicimonas caeni TaxID=2292766 RepID=A0A4Y6PSV7_PERCE|nr:hypothetical protein [Persicimonas caeni]QDG51209.1 hypothetical protein FIV42_10795 [Persicimonas caeni]QED32430.1 hypothetical protein FRD00_10790 [Persicimonas caeni]
MRVHQNQPRYYRQPSSLTAFVTRLGWIFAVAMLVLPPQITMAQQAPAAQVDTTQQQSAEGAEEAAPEAQQADEDDEEFFGEAHRRRMYEQSSLSTTTAVLYNLALPGLGNLYAEQYFYGGIAFTLMVFTLVFEGYGLVTNQSEFLWIGAGTALIAYSGSIATSVVGVREYNRKLREGLKLETVSESGPWQLPKARTIDVGFRF